MGRSRLLVEVVDSHTGEIKRVVQVSLRDDQYSSQDPRWAALYGDYLVVHGMHNNSVIYRVSDGTRLGAFYGRVLAGDAKLGLIAITNHDQEITIINAASGAELKNI